MRGIGATRDARSQADLVDAVMRRPEVTELRTKLMALATQHDEWRVLSHDSTYKVSDPTNVRS